MRNRRRPPPASKSGAPRAHEDASYAVGFGKPPKRFQFKPGLSGNPRGRPKGSQSLRTKIANVLTSKIVKREGDKEKTITAIEGMVWKQVESGLKGNERALLSTFKLASALGLLEKVGTRMRVHYCPRLSKILSTNSYRRSRSGRLRINPDAPSVEFTGATIVDRSVYAE